MRGQGVRPSLDPEDLGNFLYISWIYTGQPKRSSAVSKLWDLKINDPYLIRMPLEESFDVDTELDFEVSELMYKNKMKLP